jgi:hypothetical protein
MRKHYWLDEVYLYLSSPLSISLRHHHPAQLLPFPSFRNIIPPIGPSMPRSVLPTQKHLHHSASPSRTPPVHTQQLFPSIRRKQSPPLTNKTFRFSNTTEETRKLISRTRTCMWSREASISWQEELFSRQDWC